MVLLHEFEDNVAFVATTDSSEHNNRNWPVSGKITPMEVAGSSWGSVCVSAGRVRGGSGLGSGASGGSSQHLTTSVSPRAFSNNHSQALRMPQANNEFPNANRENVVERSR